MKNMRRVLSLIIALNLAVAMMPMAIWAADESQVGEPQIVSEDPVVTEPTEPAEETVPPEDGGEEDPVVPEPTLTKVNAYSTYKGIDLKWTPLEMEEGVESIEYTIYTHANKTFVGRTSSNTFYVRVSDELKHRYDVHVVVNGVESSTFVTSASKAKVYSIKYNLTFGSKCTLTCWADGHNHKKTFKKGQKLVADEFRMGCYRYYTNGHEYQIKRVRLKNVDAKGHYSSKNPYSREEATRYVNRRGVTSKKNTMIFVSTKSQHVYLFKKSNGKWKCDKDWIVSTGHPNTPTPSGNTQIKYKWRIHNGLNYWSACSTFSFHGKAKSWKLGAPKSGGCIRNENDQAKYIYNNYKCYSTVCVV